MRHPYDRTRALAITSHKIAHVGSHADTHVLAERPEILRKVRAPFASPNPPYTRVLLLSSARAPARVTASSAPLSVALVAAGTLSPPPSHSHAKSSQTPSSVFSGSAGTRARTGSSGRTRAPAAPVAVRDIPRSRSTSSMRRDSRTSETSETSGRAVAATERDGERSERGRATSRSSSFVSFVSLATRRSRRHPSTISAHRSFGAVPRSSTFVRVTPLGPSAEGPLCRVRAALARRSASTSRTTTSRAAAGVSWPPARRGGGVREHLLRRLVEVGGGSTRAALADRGDPPCWRASSLIPRRERGRHSRRTARSRRRPPGARVREAHRLAGFFFVSSRLARSRRRARPSRNRPARTGIRPRARRSTHRSAWFDAQQADRRRQTRR